MTTTGDAAELRADSFAPYAALVAGAGAMAFSPIFVRLAEVGPLASAFWRVVAALPALWAWQAIERRSARGGLFDGVSGAAVAAGLFFAGDLLFWHFAILNTNVANATVFASSSPVWVALGAALIFRERPARTTLIGLALAFAGGLALAAESLEIAPGRLLGEASGLIAAMFFGAYVLAVGRARRKLGGARLIFLTSLVSLVPLCLGALAFEDRLIPQTVGGVAALVALGLVCHVGGQGLLVFALGHLPATFSSLVVFLGAFASALLGWIVFGETVSPTQAAGGLAILIGVYVARPRGAPAEPRK